MKTSEIASKINGELDGDPELDIYGLADVKNLSENHLAFLAAAPEPGKVSSLPKRACLLVDSNSNTDFPCTTIRVTDPKLSFVKISARILQTVSEQGVHKSASIDDTADVQASFIGANVFVGGGSFVGERAELHHGVHVGNNVKIGEGTVLYPNVVIYDNCEIGADCVLHSGAVIGADGFGYVRDRDEIIKFPQIGKTILENGVEIGANSCIDRGALGETRIGESTKIDNLVQIAHNVSVGRRVLIAAQVGISGSVVIEDDVVIGGQVGIGDHATIKSGAVLGGRTGVFSGKTIRAGFWLGNPAQPIKKYKEQIVIMRSFSRLKKDIEELRKHLD